MCLSYYFVNLNIYLLFCMINADMIEEYGLYLLAYCMRQPVHKGKSRSSTIETAQSFIRILPVIAFNIF
jgi:hypothetical protein